MIFFIKNPNLPKNNSGRGGGGGVARVSDLVFFFQKNPNLKKKTVFFLRG